MTLKLANADRIFALDQEYQSRKQAINANESAVRAAARTGMTKPQTRAERDVWQRAGGDEMQRLHAENNAWYAHEREALTGMTAAEEAATVEAEAAVYHGVA